ncbi:MAG TPA: hypothetical protein VF615_22080 [Longimicrobiaceae bacterium]|jgi:hypothetical protein
MHLRSCAVAAAACALLLAAGPEPAPAQKSPNPAGAQKSRNPAGRPPQVMMIPPEEPPPPYPPLDGAEAEAVRAAMYGYKTAVVRRDGAAAARLVTRRSRDYFARMRDMAVFAPEAQVRAAPPMDRLVILTLRHRVPADELRALTGDAVFAYTIDHGWVGSDAARRPPGRIEGEVFGEGDRAILREGFQDTQFVREDGAWRWDMLRLFEEAGAPKVPGGPGGMTEDEFLISTLETSSGRKVSPSVWQPLP